MPRPFAVIGMCVFLVLAFFSYLGDVPRLVVASVAVIALVVFLMLKSTRREKVLPIALVACVVAVALFYAAQEYSYNRVARTVPGEARIAGRITELPVKNNGRYYYNIRTHTINGVKQKVKIRLTSVYPLDAPVYATIEGEVKVYLLGLTNEDSARYYKSTGVYLGAYFTDEKVSVQPFEGFSPYKSVLLGKQRIAENIMTLLPNEAGGLITAMLFGDRSVLEQETAVNFRRAGVSHLTAVSGLHLTIWIVLAAFFLERLYRRTRVFYLFPMVLTVIVMAMAGFSPSVSRAGFMVIMLYAGKLVDAQADSLNSLGLSVLILSVLNPFAPGHVGLQLSFFATLGIVLSANTLTHTAEKIRSISDRKVLFRALKPVFVIAAVTVSAVVFTLPVMMLNFEELSLITIPANVAVSAAAGPTMFFGALAGVLYGVPGISVLSRPFALLAGLAAKYILGAVDFFASFSFAVVNTHKTSLLLWLAGSLLIFSAGIILKKKYERGFFKTGMVLCASILLLTITAEQVSQAGIARVIVADIGNAGSVWIQKGGKTVVIACGGDRYAASRMESMAEANGVSAIDLMILPRNTDTEAGAARYVAQSVRVEHIVFPEFLQEAAFLSAGRSEVTHQGTYAPAPGFNVRFLHTQNAVSAYADIDGTTILFVFYPGCDSADIPAEWKSADILICRALPPEDLLLNGFGMIIVSSNDDVSARIASERGLDPFRVVSTAQKGNLVITTRSGLYSVGRD